MRATENFIVSDPSQVGEIRRAGQALALAHGFDESRAGLVAIVLTEAASNLVKHAGGGEVFLQCAVEADSEVIELQTIDHGRGMGNVDECMRDGHSTAGTLGGGLGAIARLSDELDIVSEPGKGTVLAARIWRHAAPKVPASPASGALCIPYPGEAVCGDAWAIRRLHGRTLAFVVDGLGHGIGAADASAEALRVFHATSEARPQALMQELHLALKKTRGAVAAVALIDHAEASLTYCGVGNIGAFIARGAASNSLISHDGTLGYLSPRFQEFRYAWSDASALVMQSDGLSMRHRPENLATIILRSPALIAASIVRDCKRGRDDLTILVVKGGPSR